MTFGLLIQASISINLIQHQVVLLLSTTSVGFKVRTYNAIGIKLTLLRHLRASVVTFQPIYTFNNLARRGPIAELATQDISNKAYAQLYILVVEDPTRPITSILFTVRIISAINSINISVSARLTITTKKQSIILSFTISPITRRSKIKDSAARIKPTI